MREIKIRQETSVIIGSVIKLNNMNKNKIKKITMEKVLNDPSYRGYHVIVIAGKVFKARTGEGASKILNDVRKKYPEEIPAITYIPDADTLILWF